MKLTQLMLVCLLVCVITLVAHGSPLPQGTYDYPSPAPPRPNTAAGAVIGGASGSMIGAAIGSSEGKTGNGALIGGLIGAAAGGVLGNQADRADEFQRYDYQLQRQRAHRSAITFDQVVQMSQSGLNPAVIVNQINSQGVWKRPTANDLIMLKQNGVSDQVIAALQTGRNVNESNYSSAYPQPVVRRAPIFVEPMIIQPIPRVYAPRPHYHPHGRHYHPAPRVSHRGGRVNLRFGF